MANAEPAKPGEDDGALLAVEVTEPLILQEPDPLPETRGTPEAPAHPPQPAAKPRSGLLAFMVGGAVLAAVGFVAARYAFPENSAAAETAIAALQNDLDATKASEASIRTELAALADRPVPDATLADRIAAMEGSQSDTSAFAERLSALEDRLSAIESASAGGEGAPAAALAAMNREIAGLKAALEAQKGADAALTADVEAASAAAQERFDAAEAAAQAAARQAALSHVRAAFESGAPIGPALEGLTALGVDIPQGLADGGDSLPTLLSLQTSFSDPARAALDAAIQADMGEGWSDRLTAFLRTQSGARSLTPREGNDPDAVLSRAEAALREGQVQSALTELAALPAPATEAMAGWMAEASRRVNADQAITDLSATLNGQ